MKIQILDIEQERYQTWVRLCVGWTGGEAESPYTPMYGREEIATFWVRVDEDGVHSGPSFIAQALEAEIPAWEEIASFAHNVAVSVTGGPF